MEVAAMAHVSIREPAYRVTVSLAPPSAAPILQTPISPTNELQTGVQVEAEIPLGHKPFMQWLFERSGT
jgi:hypothetical protein